MNGPNARRVCKDGLPGWSTGISSRIELLLSPLRVPIETPQCRPNEIRRDLTDYDTFPGPPGQPKSPETSPGHMASISRHISQWSRRPYRGTGDCRRPITAIRVSASAFGGRTTLSPAHRQMWQGMCETRTSSFGSGLLLRVVRLLDLLGMQFERPGP